MRKWLSQLARLVIFAALAALLTHYAYTRLTTQPPVAVENLYDAIPRTWKPPPDDATSEVLTVIQAFSNPVVFTPPLAPTGMTWDWSRSGGPPPATLDVTDALNGHWTPNERPHLQAVIAHLESPTTRGQFARLQALCGRPWHFDIWGSFAAGNSTLSDLRATAKALATEARYQHTHRSDVRAAWEGLKTGLWLGESLVSDGLICVLVRVACDNLVLCEFGQMTLERDIDAEMAADMDRTLAALAPARELWLRAIPGEEALAQATIDATFTRNKDGNGWLVLSADARLYNQFFTWGGTVGDNVLWNLASCFYNDRRQVEEKVQQLWAKLRGVAELPYRDAVAALCLSNMQAWPLSPCDGRCMHESGQLATWDNVHQVLAAAETRRNAVRVMIALARYRSGRGEYPEMLAALVPEHIPALPPDPFGAPSLGYVRASSDQYQLYSIGGNGQDNGGTAGSGRPGSYRIEDGDFLFVIPRGKPYSEPELVPVTSSPEADPDTCLEENSTGE